MFIQTLPGMAKLQQLLGSSARELWDDDSHMETSGKGVMPLLPLAHMVLVEGGGSLQHPPHEVS